MEFGVVLVDPPWSYQTTTRHAKLSGYMDVEYPPLTTDDLANLPIGKLGSEESVLLLWATFPFVPDALRLIKEWDYDYVTGLPWVKTEKENMEKVSYGVGYWFRGAAELLLVGRRKAAYRTNWTGLISPGLKHSRKPDSVYQLAESGSGEGSQGFPGPRVELFARKGQPGWYAVGNEAPGDGGDIRETLTALLDGSKDWKDVYHA